MKQLKPGYEKIRKHIHYLSSQPWLSYSQKFWPHHLFHFTDIRNAQNILTEEFLYSRTQLLKMKKMATDIASPDIIGKTSSKWKDYVRLYFRPRTPMQYRNEGIRPKAQLEYGGAHCPVPIVFVFDSQKILTLPSTSFSNGNLAADRVMVGNTVDFYLSLPFDKIYHDSWLSHLNDSEKKTIIFHRHAEVIIPGSLPLSSLRYICCRSQAEFETLIDLLPPVKRQMWKNKIGIDTKSFFFFSKWFYVQKVRLSSSSIVFHFNPSSLSSTFHARLEIEEIKTNRKFVWEQKDLKVEKMLEFNLSNLEHPEHYRVSFFLDENLAYQNTYLKEPKILF